MSMYRYKCILVKMHSYYSKDETVTSNIEVKLILRKQLSFKCLKFAIKAPVKFYFIELLFPGLLNTYCQFHICSRPHLCSCSVCR